jgi:hypothetical protein
MAGLGRFGRVRCKRLVLAACAAVAGVGCGSFDPSRAPQPLDLRINEVVSNNEGVWVDEQGEADDYVELYNASDHVVHLSEYVIIDRSGSNSLPALDLAPGAVQLFWADKTPEQGILHLDFKVSAEGEELVLQKKTGTEVDRVLVPPLLDHQSYARLPDGTGAFVNCGWASPTHLNGTLCGPEPPPPPPPDLSFTSFTWPENWPPLVQPLAITESALNPAGFVELENTRTEPVDLRDFSLRLAPHVIGEPWPGPTEGVMLALPAQTLEAGARAVIDVTADDTASVAKDSDFQGVLTLFQATDASVVVTDRVDFSTWPAGAVLARPEPSGTWRFCAHATPGMPNDGCAPLAERPIGDHERQLLTPGDFHALGAGRGGNGSESVEFIIDLDAGSSVVLTNSGDWDLHYTFIRERIDGDPHLDRCVPSERDEYNKGWLAFSQENYFQAEGRHYLLGTLVKYAGTNLETVEFAPGDTISSAQMLAAFYVMMARVPDPENWFIRPQGADQIERVLEIQGQVPLIGPNAPFAGVTFQSLTAAKAFGTLRFVNADDLKSTPLGPQDIVVTDEVPNDMPLIGALVTEAFQTPLAHVNILSRGRGTPNMALRDARNDPRLQPYFGKLVELDVTASDFTITGADQRAALDFWESRKPTDMRKPRLDTSVRGVQPLSAHTYADLPFLGGKAAAMAELERVPWCAGKPAVPPDRPFAIPVVHSLEHYQASGALALLAELRQDPAFNADPLVRDAGLARVRQRIVDFPMDRDILRQVHQAIADRWSDAPLRFRSSSNTEDLPGFSGAGLYTSEGLHVDEIPGGVELAVKQVWASLWDRRGYDEREYSAVDQSSVAMAVLVHPAYKSERVNGVAISRDALQPTRADRYYVNAQVGEALVTNPAPGIESDQLTVELYRTPRVVYHGHSTFTPDTPVISDAEASVLVCNLFQIHQYFRPILDPNQTNAWFAMDIEWKLMGPERQLIIKQARQYSFGDETPTGWCDF